MYFNLDKTDDPENKGVWFKDLSHRDINALINYCKDMQFKFSRKIEEYLCPEKNTQICIYRLEEHPRITIFNKDNFNEYAYDEYMTVQQFIKTYALYKKEIKNVL